MILEAHLLQSFAPSNLNRDDTGAPKSSPFGGTRRARISSQCLKRAARLALPNYGLTPDELGVRSRLIADGAAQQLHAAGHDLHQAHAVTAAALAQLGLGTAKDGRGQYLLFVRSDAATRLAEVCHANWAALAELAADAAAKEAAETGQDDGDGANTGRKANAKKRQRGTTAPIAGLRDLLDATRAVDIALWGRMIADNRDFEVHAASQVAHAISTHTCVPEYDYFTAVDDLLGSDESGAGMIGTTGFNAATYYRYANLHLGQLTTNLAGDTNLARRGALAWLQAVVHAIPTGKQNSMAAHNPPSLILAVAHDGPLWNLANAFANPIRPTATTGLLQASADALLAQYRRLAAAYGDTHIRGASLLPVDVTDQHPTDSIQHVTSFAELLGQVGEHLAAAADVGAPELKAAR